MVTAPEDVTLSEEDWSGIERRIGGSDFEMDVILWELRLRSEQDRL